MSEKSILLPCPFCGGKAEMNNSTNTFSVQCAESDDICPGRPATQDFFIEVTAIVAWNTRRDTLSTTHDKRELVDKLKLCTMTMLTCPQADCKVCKRNVEAAFAAIEKDRENDSN